MNRHDRYRLAHQVATEIHDGWQQYQGPRWMQSEGREKAFPFEVQAPSLCGIELVTVKPEGHESEFDFLVYESRENDESSRPRLTSLFHFEPHTSEDGLVYTGGVTIREKNFDWQT